MEGKTVSTPFDARNDLAEWRKEGKHAALIRLKSGDMTKFVVVPLSYA
jgi:serine protease Do